METRKEASTRPCAHPFRKCIHPEQTVRTIHMNAPIMLQFYFYSSWATWRSRNRTHSLEACGHQKQVMSRGHNARQMPSCNKTFVSKELNAYRDERQLLPGSCAPFPRSMKKPQSLGLGLSSPGGVDKMQCRKHPISDGSGGAKCCNSCQRNDRLRTLRAGENSPCAVRMKAVVLASGKA